MFPHRPAEEPTAGAAVVLHHAGPVLLTQNQQMDRVRGAHHFLLHHSPLATAQLLRAEVPKISYTVPHLKQVYNVLVLLDP